MPATCVPWNDARRSRARRPGAARVRPGERRARRSPSASSTSRRPSGSPPDTRARRVRRRVRVVDAVVDDADLDPLAVGARGAMQHVCADHRRARVGQRAVPDARVDLRDERRRTSCGSFVAGRVEVSPSSTTWKRRPTRARGSRGEAAAAAARCAACERARGSAATPRAVTLELARVLACAANARPCERGERRQARRPTMTRTRPLPRDRGGMTSVPARTRGTSSSPKCG